MVDTSYFSGPRSPRAGAGTLAPLRNGLEVTKRQQVMVRCFVRAAETTVASSPARHHPTRLCTPNERPGPTLFDHPAPNSGVAAAAGASWALAGGAARNASAAATTAGGHCLVPKLGLRRKSAAAMRTGAGAAPHRRAASSLSAGSGEAANMAHKASTHSGSKSNLLAVRRPMPNACGWGRTRE
eukprot:scaffold7213_cov118-Isochrysis_galbana.AAC.5